MFKQIMARNLIEWIDLNAWGLIRSFLCLPTNVAINEMPIIPPAWTLPYEMFFYFVCTTMFWQVKKIFNWIISMWTVGILVGYILDLQGLFLRFVLDPVFIEFMLGMAIAKLSKQRGGKACSIASVVLGTVLLAASWLGENLAVTTIVAMHRIIKFGIPFTMIIYGSVWLECNYVGNKLHKNWVQPIMLLEKISFSLYLTHYPVLIVSAMVGNRVGMTAGWNMLFVMVICVLVGVAAHYIVELPLQRLLSKQKQKNMIQVCKKRL